MVDDIVPHSDLITSVLEDDGDKVIMLLEPYMMNHCNYVGYKDYPIRFAMRSAIWHEKYEVFKAILCARRNCNHEHYIQGVDFSCCVYHEKKFKKEGRTVMLEKLLKLKQRFCDDLNMSPSHDPTIDEK